MYEPNSSDRSTDPFTFSPESYPYSPSFHNLHDYHASETADSVLADQEAVYASQPYLSTPASAIPVVPYGVIGDHMYRAPYIHTTGSIPNPIPDPTSDDWNLWITSDSPTDRVDFQASSFGPPPSLLGGPDTSSPPVRTCDEAKEFWNHLLCNIETTWKSNWATKLEQGINGGHINKKHELKQALHNLHARLESLSISISNEDPVPLQELFDKVKGEGSQAMEALKNCLSYFAGNNVESIRLTIQGLLLSLETKKFFGCYDEAAGSQSNPCQLLAQYVLVQAKFVPKSSTNRNGKSAKAGSRDILYKVSPCQNSKCKYCVQEKTKRGSAGWRSRQDVMVCLVSSLLQQSPWICPACPLGCFPFKTKEILRKHMAAAHCIPTPQMLLKADKYSTPPLSNSSSTPGSSTLVPTPNQPSHFQPGHLQPILDASPADIDAIVVNVLAEKTPTTTPESADWRRKWPNSASPEDGNRLRYRPY
ncbi:hypothetical protein CPB86DRAFT_782431 [Serendipita vermifera]|nr:hypothetical protein CPB86DRAFT_782431 [Serendipita vermifera]